MTFDPDGWLHAKSVDELLAWSRQRYRHGKVRCSDCAHCPVPRQWLLCARTGKWVSGGGHWRRCTAHEPAQAQGESDPQPRLRLVLGLTQTGESQ